MWVTIPTLPMLFPAVMYTVLPISNLHQSEITLVLMSIFIESLTLIFGLGNLIVLASWVVMYGILLVPMALLTTLHSLNCYLKIKLNKTNLTK